MIESTVSDEDLIYKINSSINVNIGNQLIGKLMRSTDLINRNFLLDNYYFNTQKMY
ncbi:hypothetical protein c7_L1262 [Megavirus courdo7]|uniref:Uncharacterized protein n=1 Tax=Megavirus courdo7 TaxID=1128135 RepID=H2ECK1_9VIRU|nr:hypothetical protein c7_L1262 [Megavirus courdo7]